MEPFKVLGASLRAAMGKTFRSLRSESMGWPLAAEKKVPAIQPIELFSFSATGSVQKLFLKEFPLQVKSFSGCWEMSKRPLG